MATTLLAAIFHKNIWKSLLSVQKSKARRATIIPVKHGHFDFCRRSTPPSNVDVQRPTLRFIQFLRKNDTRQRLGVVSWDGNYFVELSGGSCISCDMMCFINQGISMQQVQAVIDRSEWETMSDNVLLLPPILKPEKIICLHQNYATGRWLGLRQQEPSAPVYYNKLNSALIGPNACVIKPDFVKQMQHQLNLAVVLGRRARNVNRAQAMDYVFGYCMALDISAWDWQCPHYNRLYLLGRSMDTFCPIGPAIAHKCLVPDIYNLSMKTFVNGDLKLKSNTGRMLYRIDEIIEHLSRFMTLKPGDIILTGSPDCLSECERKPLEFLNAGDLVESRIKLLGRLKNRIVDEL